MVLPPLPSIAASPLSVFTLPLIASSTRKYPEFEAPSTRSYHTQKYALDLVAYRHIRTPFHKHMHKRHKTNKQIDRSKAMRHETPLRMHPSIGTFNSHSTCVEHKKNPFFTALNRPLFSEK